MAQSMDIDQLSDSTANEVPQCVHCEKHAVKVYFYPCKHGICKTCCFVYNEPVKTVYVTCPVPRCMPITGPSSSGMSIEDTPGDRRPSSPSDLNKLTPSKEAHIMNERTIFNTLEEYKQNVNRPIALFFPTPYDVPKEHLYVATHPETGEIFISDYLNHQVHVFKADGTYKTSFGSKGDGEGQFEDPYGIAVHMNSEVAVADSTNQRLQIFRNSGQEVETVIGSAQLSSFRMVKGVAFDKKSYRIFCVDYKYVKIFSLNDSTDPVSCFTHDSIEDLHDIAAGEDFVYATSRCNGVIYKFTHGGQLSKKITDGESQEQQRFAGITLDGRGNLLVCDEMNKCLKVFDTETEKFVDQCQLPGKPRSVAVQRDTMNIVVSYFPSGDQLGEGKGTVAMLINPEKIK